MIIFLCIVHKGNIKNQCIDHKFRLVYMIARCLKRNIYYLKAFNMFEYVYYHYSKYNKAFNQIVAIFVLKIYIQITKRS